MKIIYIFLSLTFIVFAVNDVERKQKLNCDMTLQYKKLPKEQESLAKVLSEGVFYGRVRVHHFNYNDRDSQNEHDVTGFGGSLIYKSGYFKGLGVTTGIYMSYNPWSISEGRVGQYKSGKDAFSRYNVATDGDYGLTSLAQAYLEYKDKKSSLKIGRQRFESFLVKSNDTKMIPNTFEGISFETHRVTDTRIRSALFTRQKLRDHSKFHHVLAYGDSDEAYAQWLENDDGGMHRGLTVSKLQEHKIDDKLFIIDLKNSALKDTVFRLNYTAVPELLSFFMLEGKRVYRVDGTRVVPSVRIMQQYDNGAGVIGGANLLTNTVGYSNPNNLDAGLVATRFDIVQSLWSLRLGYSSVSDEGDIVAPWRGFPTASYTRAMGQRNWHANTDTFLIRADYNLGRAGIIPTARLMTRYAIQNFDDDKPGVPSDSRVWTLNLVKRGLLSHPTLYTKLRFAHIKGERDTLAIDGTLKPDNSYSELRLELNYLF